MRWTKTFIIDPQGRLMWLECMQITDSELEQAYIHQPLINGIVNLFVMHGAQVGAA